MVAHILSRLKEFNLPESIDPIVKVMQESPGSLHLSVGKRLMDTIIYKQCMQCEAINAPEAKKCERCKFTKFYIYYENKDWRSQ